MPKRQAAPLREPVSTEINRKLATLHGRSRSELERDDRRGASSPLGMGSHSKPVKRRERI